MISLYSKDAFITSLCEARKNGYEEFAKQMELAKSIYGKKFAEKVWEYLNVNLEYANTNEGIDMVDEKISHMIYKPLNETTTEIND